MFDRYAIYYAPPPDGALANFGAHWLGWDVNTAQEAAHPKMNGLPKPVSGLTQIPRKYGFHATLKAPFHLNENQSERSLTDAVRAFAKTHHAFEIGAFRVANLGSFVALTEVDPNPKLAEFASDCVMKLDTFRAPLTPTDIKRRMQANLSPRQEHLMRTWGYPYILEEFRFHLTLTGKLEQADATSVVECLSGELDSMLADPFRMDDICLCGQLKSGQFQIIERFPLLQ